MSLAVMPTETQATEYSCLTLQQQKRAGRYCRQYRHVHACSRCAPQQPRLFMCGAGSALPDLLMALESLGYRRLDIIEMAQKLVTQNPTADISKLVPMALKEISKGK